MSVKTKHIINTPPIIDHPELIKVMTIKRKFVEQMTTHEAIPEDCEVVGRAGPFIVVRLRNGELAKVHNVEWVKGLMVNSTDYKAALAETHAVIDGYVQLFED